MAQLFEPLKLRSITLKNRLVVSPMCQYSSEDGFANDWHMVHLGSRAVGGASLIIFEATAVSPEARITPSDLGIWKDEHIDPLKRITQFIEQHNSVPGIQLAHAGRKASHHKPWEGGGALSKDEGSWQTVAPSPIPVRQEGPLPLELDQNGINKVIQDFKTAIQRSIKAGFKLIEIHAAHGYLFHEFYSPLTNKRTDQYGGSFENRIRLLLEVTEMARKEWPMEYPLIVRISASDWVEGGWTIEDSIALSKILKEKGVDLIDCSSGGNVHTKIPVGPLYQLPFAEQIKQEAGIKTGAVGMITTVQQAEEIVSYGKADLVILARQMLRDPYFPLHASKQLGAEIKWPHQYLRAKD